MVPNSDLGRLASSDANPFKFPGGNTFLPFSRPSDMRTGAA